MKKFSVSVTYNGSDTNIPGESAHLRISNLKNTTDSHFAQMKNFKYIKVFGKNDELTCYSFRYGLIFN